MPNKEFNSEVCSTLGIPKKGCSIVCEHVYLSKENCEGCFKYNYPYVLDDVNIMAVYNNVKEIRESMLK